MENVEQLKVNRLMCDQLLRKINSRARNIKQIFFNEKIESLLIEDELVLVSFLSNMFQ